MAKKRSETTSELPPGVDIRPIVADTPKPVEDPKPDQPKPLEVQMAKKQLSVPMVSGLGGYSGRRVDVRFDNSDQAAACRAVLHGLQESEAKLKNGRYVRTGQDVFKWLMEQVGGE